MSRPRGGRRCATLRLVSEEQIEQALRVVRIDDQCPMAEVRVFDGQFQRRQQRLLTDLRRSHLVDRDAGIDIGAVGSLWMHAVEEHCGTARVIAAIIAGALTGYAGGLERKRWLLRHEGARLS